MEYGEGTYMGTNWITCPRTVNTETGTSQVVLKVKLLGEPYHEFYITNGEISAAGGNATQLIHSKIDLIYY